ncbi:MAG: site-specific integrase [Nitratireductor sp.]|nr:site-specific integrase [Nitratireductor sp.]
MAKYPGLRPRGNVWYVRKRVPTDLVEVMGRKEIWRSLNTQDRKIAEREYWAVANDINRQFEAARRGVQNAPPSELGLPAVERIARTWFRKQVSIEEDNVFSGLGVANLDERLAELDQEEGDLLGNDRERDWIALQGLADQLLIEDGFAAKLVGHNVGLKTRKTPAVDKQSESYRKLIELVRRGQLELIRRSRGWLTGTAAPSSFDPFFAAEVSQLSTAADHGRTKFTSLGRLIELYLASDETLSERELLDYRASFRVLIEIAGEEIDVRALKRDHFNEVSQLLRRLPSNAKKGKDRAGLTLKEIAAKAEQEGVEAISYRTANKYLGHIRRLMQWAVDEELVDKNRAENLRHKRPSGTRDEDAKLPFNSAELLLIFHSKKFLTWAEERRADFWVPIIALHHGMRLEEIVQLRVGDLSEQDGVKFFRVHAEDGNHLKNANAPRKVPIHPAMWDFGLTTLLRVASRAPDTRLFSDIKRASTGKYGTNYSKRFSSYLKQVGAKHDRNSFHSLRHTWRDACRECGVADPYAIAIGGWSAGEGTHAKYGSGYGLETLDREMRKVAFPKIDLAGFKVLRG